MLKCQIVSDLHFESLRDSGLKIAENLPEAKADLLILAGDINAKDSTFVITQLCSYYKHVIWVLGNHEYYGSNVVSCLENYRKLYKHTPNLHFLENESITLEGQRFIGATGWYPDKPLTAHAQKYLADMTRISGFLPNWAMKKNQETREYLAKEVKESDVLITHHLTTWESVNPFFEGEITNYCFVGEFEDILMNNRPKLAIHGHTHRPVDYIFEKTRIICNPRGYGSFQELSTKENPDWNPWLTVNL